MILIQVYFAGCYELRHSKQQDNIQMIEYHSVLDYQASWHDLGQLGWNQLCKVPYSFSTVCTSTLQSKTLRIHADLKCPITLLKISSIFFQLVSSVGISQ